MDLSQPSIAIRERTMLEIFDLTLHVFRDHFFNILLLLGINAVPWVAVDLALVWGKGEGDLRVELELMMLLMISQSQVGTLLITQYLGTAMFSGRPTVTQTLKSFFAKSKYWIWSHGVVRLVLPVLVVVGWFQEPATFLVVIMLMFALGVRAFRPFISEVLLLEQPAIRKAKSANGLTLARRSKDLHKGEVLGSCFMGGVVGSCLMLTVTSFFFHVDAAMGLVGGWEQIGFFLYWPISGWLVAAFLATFRFLYYINTRIVQEGWEISLKLMAEKQKLITRDDY